MTVIPSFPDSRLLCPQPQESRTQNFVTFFRLSAPHAAVTYHTLLACFDLSAALNCSQNTNICLLGIVLTEPVMYCILADLHGQAPKVCVAQQCRRCISAAQDCTPSIVRPNYCIKLSHNAKVLRVTTSGDCCNRCSDLNRETSA